MAVIENVSTEDGDILRIKTEAPIVGLISLTDFVDTTVGESQTDYFRKEFRFSLDGGLTFSDWIQLTLLNISNVDISKFDSFVIEYRYIRVGNTPEVNLEFNDILVSGVIEDLPYPLYKKTIFDKFFNVNDLNVFGWAVNVLEKIYQKGLILPDYIERANNQSNLEDEDFITFWLSVTHFFAIIVYFSRQFHDFENNEILIKQFLNSKDLIITNRGYSDLKYLYDNYINEYSKRGTSAILDQSELGKNIDGEFIRLIDHKIYEELLFSLFRNFDTGWCLGKSSPTWKGTENIINVIKGFEYTDDVTSLGNYPLLEPQYTSIENGKMKISGVPNGIISGIGGSSKKVNIDHSQDYEISFRISQSIKEDNLLFGCRVWDKNDNELLGLSGLIDISTLLDSIYFMNQGSLNLPNVEYWVRGILFNSNVDESLVEHKLNIGIGNNLILPSNAAKIEPIIAVLGTGSNNITLIDKVKIRPRKLNFSRGVLGVHNIIYTMAPNNNGEMTPEQIEVFIKEKLIPYNSQLKTNWL